MASTSKSVREADMMSLLVENDDKWTPIYGSNHLPVADFAKKDEDAIAALLANDQNVDARFECASSELMLNRMPIKTDAADVMTEIWENDQKVNISPYTALEQNSAKKAQFSESEHALSVMLAKDLSQTDQMTAINPNSARLADNSNDAMSALLANDLAQLGKKVSDRFNVKQKSAITSDSTEKAMSALLANDMAQTVRESDQIIKAKPKSTASKVSEVDAMSAILANDLAQHGRVSHVVPKKHGDAMSSLLANDRAQPGKVSQRLSKNQTSTDEAMQALWANDITVRMSNSGNEGPIFVPKSQKVRPIENRDHALWESNQNETVVELWTNDQIINFAELERPDHKCVCEEGHVTLQDMIRSREKDAFVTPTVDDDGTGDKDGCQQCIGACAIL